MDETATPTAGAQPNASTDTPTDAPAAAPDGADPSRQYRLWASRLFAILAVVAIIGSVFALGSDTGDPILTALLLASGLGGVAIFAALFIGVDRASPWAVQAIAPACWMILAFGILRAMVALGAGQLTVPLEAVGAVLVLSRPRAAADLAPLGPPDRRRSLVALGVLLAAELLPAATVAISRGGIASAQPGDLTTIVEARCDQAAANGPVEVTVRWTWARSELLSPTADALLVAWYASTNGSGSPDAGLALHGQPRIGSANVWVGGEGPASAAIEPHVAEAQGVEFGIHHPDGLEGARIDLELSAVDTTASSGSVEVWTWYAHGDRWIVQSQLGDCQWETGQAGAR